MASFEIHVDGRKCRGCEECLEICTALVFEMRDARSVPVNARECIGCRSCVQVCEENAITVTELEPRLSETCLALLRDIL